MIENIRKNPICVISKNTYGEHAVHDIQTNNSWSANPYGDDYAVVPDGMVEDILATKGYCDITLDKSGSEVVSFVAREIPEIEPEIEVVPMGEPSNIDEFANAILEGVNEV